MTDWSPPAVIDPDITSDLFDLLERPAWMADAACRHEDTALFFPERGVDIGPAQAICRVCPVREDCLEYGVTEYAGIWGGLGAKSRKRRTRRPAA